MFAYTATASRDLDQAAQDAGTSGFELMRRAGQAVFDEVSSRYPQAHALLVFAGKGNNGGDAYVVAGLAALAGWQVRLWQIVGHPEQLSGEAAAAAKFALSCGVIPDQTDPVAQLQQVRDSDGNCLVIDGLFGTGLSRAPASAVANLMTSINESAARVVALDVPSGLNGTSGATPGVAIRAALTLTFIGMKLGLLTGRGPDLAGERVLVPLGVSERTRQRVAGVQVFDAPVTRLAPRQPSAYKNQFGHLLVVGGDQGSGGAIILAAEAALRSGAGLVSVATRLHNVTPLLVRRPELMACGVEGAADLRPLLSRATLFVVGPGMGQGAWGEQLLQLVFQHVRASRERQPHPMPLVLDADALNLVASGMTPPRGCVMTPHPGEAARLLGCSVQDVAADRVAAVLAIAQRYGAFVVLKGVGSLVAAPPDQAHEEATAVPATLMGVCALGNPGMASAGMGDVLSGIVGGLIAQEGIDGTSVARAVQVHAAAGDRAAAIHGAAGMVAADLIDCLPTVLR